MAEKWWYVIGGAAAATLAGLVLRGWPATRRNEAGISTGLGTRLAQIGTWITRTIRRKVWLRLRQAISSRERRKELEHEYHMKSAEEVTQIMGSMKGVFMKLGQIMSFANDNLPPHAQQMLKSLQKDSPPMSFDLARGVVESELGGDLSRFFKDVDEEPLAAASIGQVHRARLKDGTQVVLKVQYPGVDTAIENDLRMSGGLAAMIGSFARNIDAKAVVTELKARLRDELDYRRELHNQQIFCDIWAGHPYIRIPQVYPDFSAKKVLCQEYKRGLDFYEFLDAASTKEKRFAVHVLQDFVFDSMHLYHVFNGDPHPGNYIFHEDGGITFLDFGCIKYFPEGFVDNLKAMSAAIMEKDRDRFVESILKMKMVLPGRPFDPELLWNFFLYHSAPFAENAAFEFTAEWVARAKEVMQVDVLQQINLPPDMLFFNRITFGLNAIFQKLGAHDNFHAYYRRYIYPEENVRPSLAFLGVELPERFLTPTPAPARYVENIDEVVFERRTPQEPDSVATG